MELANAFGELTDPGEQRRRLEAEMAEKQRIYGERYPIDEDFLAALAHMPPASGAALGFDRLVMLATGAARIEQVLWTPWRTGHERTRRELSEIPDPGHNNRLGPGSAQSGGRRDASAGMTVRADLRARDTGDQDMRTSWSAAGVLAAAAD